MSVDHMLRVGLLLFALVAQEEAKPLPEVHSFLDGFRRSLHTDDLLLSDYTYTEKRTSVQLDSNRKPKKTEVNVYQIFPGTCERPGYRRQIVKNGVTLSEKDLEKQDQERQKRIASGGQRRRRGGPPFGRRTRNCVEGLKDEERILDDLFGLYDIRIVGREPIGDDPTLLVTFKPRPNYKPQTRQGGIMKHVAGRAWVSEDDHQLVRLDAEVFETVSIGFGILAKLEKGTHILSERRKFNDEVWLPARTELSFSARLFMLKGFNIQQIVEYSDHKKFTVDTILTFPEHE
jgi:hypothetical protein